MRGMNGLEWQYLGLVVARVFFRFKTEFSYNSRLALSSGDLDTVPLIVNIPLKSTTLL